MHIGLERHLEAQRDPRPPPGIASRDDPHTLLYRGSYQRARRRTRGHGHGHEHGHAAAGDLVRPGPRHTLPAQTNVTQLYPSTTSAARALSRPSGTLRAPAGRGGPGGRRGARGGSSGAERGARRSRPGVWGRSIHAPVRRRRIVGQLQLAVLLDGRQDVGDRERRGVLELQLGQVLLQQGRLGRQAHRQLGSAQLRQRLRRTRRVAAALRGHPTGRHSGPLDGSASSGSRGESGASPRGAGRGAAAAPPLDPPLGVPGSRLARPGGTAAPRPPRPGGPAPPAPPGRAAPGVRPPVSGRPPASDRRTHTSVSSLFVMEECSHVMIFVSITS